MRLPIRPRMARGCLRSIACIDIFHDLLASSEGNPLRLIERIVHCHFTMQTCDKVMTHHALYLSTSGRYFATYVVTLLTLLARALAVLPWTDAIALLRLVLMLLMPCILLMSVETSRPPCPGH